MVLLDWLNWKNTHKVLNATPSALIEMAVKDLEKCEKQKKKYKIDMGEWHIPNHQCAVCLAGAVMAQTLKAPATLPLNPGDFRDLGPLGFELNDRLDAVDDFRGGHVVRGLMKMGIDNKTAKRVIYILARTYNLLCQESVTVMQYDKDPDLFKGQMRAIAKACKKAGI